MKKKQQVRQNFKDAVHARDGYTCKWCGEKYTPETAEHDLDAHHITDRDDMPSGGYVAENGISLCAVARDGQDSCHMKAEWFHISKGEGWTTGMHPDDLYELIGSSYEEAVAASERS